MAGDTFPPASLQSILSDVTGMLKQRKESVAVAETAAGGLISSSLLAIPGASGYYKGGLTLYTLPSRIAYANWTEGHMQNYTGPTPGIVRELAENTRSNIAKAEQSIGKGDGPTYVVGESGTAGPTASGEGKNRQPGYVALAVSTPSETVTREVETGKSDRQQNMLAFAEEALKLLRDVMKGSVKL